MARNRNRQHAFVILVLLLVIAGVVLFVYSYLSGQITKPMLGFTTLNKDVLQNTSPDNLADSIEYKTEVVASGLVIPWTLLFTAPDRLLVTERGGNVRQIIEGQLQAKPIHVFTDVAHVGEAGLLGMTKDIDYETNKRLYFCMSYRKGGNMTNKIVVATDGGDKLSNIKTLIDNLPSAQFHAGCRIAFGPDDKLYVTTGDMTEKGLAQDPQSLAGKMLRYNIDGSIPSDGPISGSPVYSLGHRNVQGIAWDESGQLYATEHGPSGNDGPGGGDEINKIDRNGNYGWPIVHHEDSDDRFIDPLLVMTPAEAPASAMFYSGKLFPQWKGQFFFGALRGEGLMRIEIVKGNLPGRDKMFFRQFGRIRDVIESPTGEIYFTTSNRDGRGDVNEGDDKVIRIVSK